MTKDQIRETLQVIKFLRDTLNVLERSVVPYSIDYTHMYIAEKVAREEIDKLKSYLS